MVLVPLNAAAERSEPSDKQLKQYEHCIVRKIGECDVETVEGPCEVVVEG